MILIYLISYSYVYAVLFTIEEAIKYFHGSFTNITNTVWLLYYVWQKRLFKTAFCFFGYSIITYIQDFDRQFSTYSRALRVCGRNFGNYFLPVNALSLFKLWIRVLLWVTDLYNAYWIQWKHSPRTQTISTFFIFAH